MFGVVLVELNWYEESLSVAAGQMAGGSMTEGCVYVCVYPTARPIPQ